ncbi:MAG: hypothetical protein OEN50_09650, partial [Deltaproteobacteria bacterium]|nr:hypothetical protein [Deltaproteobacteria bacterium]
GLQHEAGEPQMSVRLLQSPLWFFYELQRIRFVSRRRKAGKIPAIWIGEFILSFVLSFPFPIDSLRVTAPLR